MAWPFRTSGWGTDMLGLLAEQSQQSHLRMADDTWARSEHFPDYQQQQLQSILSNIRATAHQARPWFVQSHLQSASALSLAHSQQTNSPVTYNHSAMYPVQLGCDSRSPHVQTDRLQQWQIPQQDLCPVNRSSCWSPQVPVRSPIQIDYNYKYSLPAQSPSYQDPPRVANQAQFQRSGDELAFRRIAMFDPLGIPSATTTARHPASFHTPPPRYDQTYITNTQLRAHDISRVDSPSPGYSLSSIQPYDSGARSASPYGPLYPRIAPIVQPHSSAVGRTVRWDQEHDDQTEWQGRQGNEREPPHRLTADNIHPHPPKRQRIGTTNDDLGQLFTAQQILGVPVYEQDIPTTQALARTVYHMPKTAFSETANRESHVEASASIVYTCSQHELDRIVGAGLSSAQAQQKPLTPRSVTVDDDQQNVFAFQSTSPNLRPSSQPIPIPHERQDDAEAPAQTTIAPRTDLGPPEHHSPDRDRSPVVISSSPEQTQISLHAAQQLLTSIIPQAAPAPLATTPLLWYQKDARLAEKDICTQKPQASPHTPPKARPRARNSSRKKSGPPKPRSTPVRRPVVDVTELNVLKLQSFCRPYGSSESARRGANLLHGTHRSSRHFKCTCAYPISTCFAPQDPLGCPKLFEAEQRMKEANKGRDRCLEVRYIGSRLPDCGKAM